MMAAMAEMTEDPVLGGAVEPAETVTHETSLIETFENPLEFLQHVEPTEPAAPEETDGTEKPEQEDRQQAEERDTEEDGQKDTLRDGEKDNQQDTLGDGEKDRQQDTQRDGEKDRQQDTQEDRQQAEETNGQPDGRQEGQTVRQPAAESSIKESKWVMGSQCRAVWSEDGRVYPATVLSVDGERCRVFFNGYGNQEDVDVSALTSPVAVVPQPATQNSKDWKPGLVCRAVFSEDGLVYPAVVLWVKGQRCRVRFDNYNNEEEKDVGSLLRHNELHGSGRPPAAKGSNWQSSVTSSNSDWKSRGDENQGERGGGDGKREARGGERRSAWKDEEQNSSWVKDKQSDQGHTQMEEEEKKRGNKADKPTYHSSSFFPPFPPPPPLQPGSADSVSFVPPPPPLWQFSSTAAADSSSSMLMLWYMCGFHTGSYMAQQGFKSNSKD
uniref:Tudor domain-containing protein n=1 Tax=Gasterosteus aculeatus aculeatus TaxID=481459 RepID=A0AAQ4NTS6_GASAC|nr:survival motor neuron protein-like isoform X1 [Gasterosteus aculeatus aculeatus]XP_040041285.1 survival motor neuron protein-like isoform X1 [Gasterosteus aculeatus aculeatus]XP_040041286.1 survival motor neuron protein-like isoform X1 [Gasterosteus aculeatus aculeatus]